MEVHKVKGIQCPDDTLARSLKKKKGAAFFSLCVTIRASGRLHQVGS